MTVTVIPGRPLSPFSWFNLKSIMGKLTNINENNFICAIIGTTIQEVHICLLHGKEMDWGMMIQLCRQTIPLNPDFFSSWGGLWNVVHPTYRCFPCCEETRQPLPSLSSHTTCPPTEFNRTLFSFRSSFYLRTLLLCNKEPTRPRTLPTTDNPLRQLWICTVLLLIGNKSNLFYCSFSSPLNVLFGWLQTESVIALSLVLHAVNNNNTICDFIVWELEWQEIVVQWFRHSPCRPNADE